MAPTTDAVGADLDRLVRRVRGFSPRIWQTGGRREAVRELARRLAALTAGERPLPSVPDHALGDVLAVVGRDALDVGLTDDVAELVAEGLSATR